MSQAPVHVLGISGSLRKKSFNTALLHAAAEVAPEGLTLEVADLHGIPLYDADVEAEGRPAAVEELRQRIAKADALLFASPEYNYSFSGVLKNAIDWLSRPPKDTPLSGKPIAITGATGGNFGTIRAQLHLRQVCVFTNMLPLNKPEVLVARAMEKFDEELRLTDVPTRELLRDLMKALDGWTRKLRG